MRFFWAVLLLASLTAFQANAAIFEGEYKMSEECDVRSFQEGFLNRGSELKKIRIEGSQYHADFYVDEKDYGWIGGFNVCGSDRRHTEETRVVKQDLDRYIVYSAHCGGWFDVFDSKAQIVLDKSSGKIVYARVKVKVAVGISPTRHLGPIKYPYNQIACKDPSFEESILQVSGDFEKLEKFIANHKDAKVTPRRVEEYYR